MAQQFNPYAADEAVIEQTVPEYSMPRGTYAAPSLESGDAYNDEFGWGPRLRTSSVETPSAQRLGVIPRQDFRPDPEKAPQRWYHRRDRDDAQRHAAEDQDANGWVELQPGPKRFGPNPRSAIIPDSRVTQQMSPATYSFTRPFDQFNRQYDGVAIGSKRTFNGWHFSMADNRRDYEAVGSMPVRSGRNTYRTEPQPWDTNIVDLPPDESFNPVQVTRDYELPSRSRSYRL